MMFFVIVFLTWIPFLSPALLLLLLVLRPINTLTLCISSALPFLHERKAVSIMRVAFLVCGTFVVMTLLKFNFSTYVFDMYFGE